VSEREREREREREKREHAGANRLKKHAKTAHHLSVYIFARVVCVCTSK